MDEPSTPPPPAPISTAVPLPEPTQPEVLSGDARGWPQGRSPNSNKTVIGVAIGGCAFILLGFIAFVCLLAWLGYRSDRTTQVNGSYGKPGTEQPDIGGKPVADGGAGTGGRGTDPNTWISSDDYPPDALNRGEQGTVAIAWEVSPDGLPLRCTVEQSSGHPSLDTAACSAIMHHAQYPALPAGQVTVRRETRRVVWRLPEGAGGK